MRVNYRSAALCLFGYLMVTACDICRGATPPRGGSDQLSMRSTREAFEIPMATELGTAPASCNVSTISSRSIWDYDVCHDAARSWDRHGDGIHDLKITKLVATVILTSNDTALLYQGEEIGQRTAVPKRHEDVRDPMEINGWPKEKGRDGERTPMQWDGSAQAGFSTNAQTWLPVALSDG
jgi:glycosidase